MTEWYMLTIPKRKETKRMWKLFVEKFDIHKWIVGDEIGRGGYHHYQARIYTSADFNDIQRYWGDAHIEKSSGEMSYERKGRKYWCSEDTTLVRKCRFGKPDRLQRAILDRAKRQGDRNITVVYDPRGNSGKTWLCRWLYETGQGYYVPPTLDSVKSIIQFVSSGYRGEQYIVIDIPRSWKWSEQLYTGLESIKDGLVYDTRYHASMRDIWGVRVIVMTNTEPTFNKLSFDRWDVIKIKRGSVPMAEDSPQPPPQCEV